VDKVIIAQIHEEKAASILEILGNLIENRGEFLPPQTSQKIPQTISSTHKVIFTFSDGEHGCVVRAAWAHASLSCYIECIWCSHLHRMLDEGRAVWDVWWCDLLRRFGSLRSPQSTSG
jgi:hypothetical protein